MRMIEQVEESQRQLMVRNEMKNPIPSSKAYRHLIDACLSQPMSLAKDINYNTETQVTIINYQTTEIKPMIVTSTTLSLKSYMTVLHQVHHSNEADDAIGHFYRTARQVLEQHGVVSMESPSLLPRGEETIQKDRERRPGDVSKHTEDSDDYG